MKELGNEKEQKLLQELRDKGETVYSISRLNCFDQCNYQYFLTYIQRERGKGSCYGEMGTFSHNSIEAYYRGTHPKGFNFTKELKEKAEEIQMLDMGFPSESIKATFLADMSHFTDNYQMLDGQFTLEKMFIVKVGNYYLHGYIDAIQELLDENLEPYQTNIIDWKTSSKFAGSAKRQHAGRQLLLYKKGLEEYSEMKIDNVMWDMLKYIYVCHVQANKKTKKRMVQRSKIVETMEKAWRKDMTKAGVEEFEQDVALEMFDLTSDMEMLPECLQEKYWLEECLDVYEINEELEKETEDYVIKNIQEIEEKVEANAPESEWHSMDIEAEGDFYCNTLCSHRQSCKFLKEHREKNKKKWQKR